MSKPTPKIFQQRLVPEGTRLAGLSMLVDALAVEAPVRAPTCVSTGHIRGSRRKSSDWTIYDKRYWPGECLADHLIFAMRHEVIDLLVLARTFKKIPPAEIQGLLLDAPTSAHGRRVWFLYETLTGRTIDVPDAANVAAVDLLDPERYFTGAPMLSRRHRIRDNLLGTAEFCPIIRRTPALQAHIDRQLGDRAKATIGRAGSHMVARAASFMLLSDSRASFEIEGEHPPRNRLERWGRAVLQAGKNDLATEEIVRLHSVLIEDMRFTTAGFRSDGVFLGERDQGGDPLPEFIGARPEDLASLMQGLIASNARMTADAIDAILQAAATAFAFVYVHPFDDGNGRVHRCLVHHVLAERKFSPPGMVFPVSSVMLDRVDEYRATLQSHSAPLMDFIQWRPTSDRNVEVRNDTADLYRYFDATDASEFLYACVQRTVEHDLPAELDHLRRHDAAMRRIMDVVEIPDRKAADLILFVRQNGGTLPRKRREKEFALLTSAETETIEAIVRDEFDGFDRAS